MKFRIAIGALAVMAMAGPCLAADPRYPDWPCAQAKVLEIFVAALWAGPPLDDASNKWKDDPKVGDLVGKPAARKFPIEDAQKSITEFLPPPVSPNSTTPRRLLP